MILREEIFLKNGGGAAAAPFYRPVIVKIIG